MANTRVISKKQGLCLEIGPAEEHAMALSALKTKDTSMIPFAKASFLEYVHNLNVLSKPVGKIDLTSLLDTYNQVTTKELEKLFQDYYLHNIPLMDGNNNPISPSEYVCTILQMVTAFADIIDNNNGDFFKKNRSKKEGFAKPYRKR